MKDILPDEIICRNNKADISPIGVNSIIYFIQNNPEIADELTSNASPLFGLIDEIYLRKLVKNIDIDINHVGEFYNIYSLYRWMKILILLLEKLVFFVYIYFK